MIEVVKEFSFDAAHYLPHHQGACRNLHGHHYVLQIGVAGTVGPDGMVQDFANVKAIVQDLVIEHLDHAYLNEVKDVGFPYTPTAENMVMWIRDRLVGVGRLEISLVRLYETPTSYAEWRAA